MNTIRWLTLTTMLLTAAVLGGCSKGEPGKLGLHDSNGKSDSVSKESKEEAAVKANLAKLSADDRKLAEAQKLCPITGDPLGKMGVPVKVTIKDHPVFLCCKGCQEDALSAPYKTLAKVGELKKNTTPPR